MTDKVDEYYIHQLISKNLRRFRESKKISQLDLALKADLTHNFINDIENCKKWVSAKTLAKLSRVLEIEPFQFFLPNNFSSNIMEPYMYDFSDSIHKAVREVTDQYLSKL